MKVCAGSGIDVGRRMGEEEEEDWAWDGGLARRAAGWACADEDGVGEEECLALENRNDTTAPMESAAMGRRERRSDELDGRTLDPAAGRTLGGQDGGEQSEAQTGNTPPPRSEITTDDVVQPTTAATTPSPGFCFARNTGGGWCPGGAVWLAGSSEPALVRSRHGPLQRREFRSTCAWRMGRTQTVDVVFAQQWEQPETTRRSGQWAVGGTTSSENVCRSAGPFLRLGRDGKREQENYKRRRTVDNTDVMTIQSHP